MQIWRLLLLVGLMLAAAALGALGKNLVLWICFSHYILGLLQVSMGASGVLAFIVDFALCLLLVALIYRSQLGCYIFSHHELNFLL